MRLAFLLFFSISASAFSADGKPNVLFIAVDDLRPELATYGAEVKTPHFDRLAASGMRFDRAYCQQAVCGASRLSIMGGLYPTRTKEQTFHIEGWRDRHPDLLTMNAHFGANGYHTAGLGKIYHGASGKGIDQENWHEWISLKRPHYAIEANEAILKKDGRKGPSTEAADVPDDFYIDGWRAKTAAEKIREFAKKPDQPFFFGVGFTKPHLPFVAPKKYWDLYERSEFKMPENAGIPPGYPEYAANQSAGELRNYPDIKKRMPKEFPEELNQRLLHGYAACVSYTDANLGTVLDALEESGLAENTIVVLWGDHGWKLGDHSSWCKHTNFECDARVPLIVRAPEKAGNGKPTNRLVELIDLYPTLCELAGLPTPEHCQGRSFAGLLDDPDSGHRSSAYSSYPANAGKGIKQIGHSIRFGNYRYTEWRDVKTGEKTNKAVLTNLKIDPGEVTNVAQNPKHADMLEKAVTLLDERVADAVSNE